jgi:hypothetical protein
VLEGAGYRERHLDRVRQRHRRGAGDRGAADRRRAGQLEAAVEADAAAE